MSRKAMIMQYAAVACGMAGLFLGMGGEGNVQTGGEFSGSLFAAAMILLLSALALGRMSFVVNDWEKQQRKIHKVQRGPGGIRMKEFDSIRIVDKGESISFEMTGDVAGNPHEAIMFLFRAASGLIAAVTKEDADPQEAAEAFGKVFTKHVAQDIQDERGRRAEEKAGEKEAAEHEQKRENEPQAVY